MNKKYYNYRRNEEELNEEIIFCSNNPDDSDHYGNYQRIFQATKKTLNLNIESSAKEELFNHFEDWIMEWNPCDELSTEVIEENLNPKNIVETAGAWDNIEFINYLYESTNFFNKFDGVETSDGAVFFEVTKENLVSLKKI